MTAHSKKRSLSQWKGAQRYILLLISILLTQVLFSQDLSLSLKNVSLEKAFREIEAKVEQRFVYTKEMLEKSQTVSINVRSTSLVKVLDIIFENQPLEFSVDDKFIKVRFKNVQPGQEHTIDVRGKITDERYKPLTNVSVVASKTKKMVITNVDGDFILNDVLPDDVLIISSIGYYERKEPIEGRTQVNVRLSVMVSELDNTVIVAYGTTTQRLNTGNVSKVKGEEISKQPVSNPLQALQGRVPGLVITQSNGITGSSIKVQLRGQTSIGPAPSRLPANDPLYIIDGLPYSIGSTFLNQLTSAAGNPNLPSSMATGFSPLNGLNPSDIESIEILKDADATSIYGSRGANGVVIITTKKGKVGKAKVDFNLNRGISEVTRTMDLLNTEQYIQMRREAFSNDNLIATTSKAPDLLVWDTTRNTDLKELLIGGTARFMDAQVSLSGGSEQIQYFIGCGFHRETTVYPGDMSSNRGAFHSNLNHTSTSKKFNIGLTINYSETGTNIINTDLSSFLNLPPNIPSLFDSSGKLRFQEGGVSFANPLAYLLREYNLHNENLIGNLQLNYCLLPGLNIRSNLGYNSTKVDEQSFIPNASLNPNSSALGSANFANSLSRGWIIEPQIEYLKQTRSGKLNLLLGATWQSLDRDAYTLSGTGYTDDLLIRSIEGAAALNATNDFMQYRYNAVFGRLNYNLKNRYILNLSYRRDGSSRFGPERQFANFVAGGFAWIFSESKFVQQTLPFLTYGKLRASYGTSGSDQIGDYQFLDSWVGLNQIYQGLSGMRPGRLFNPDFSWEVNRKFEFATDLGFLKGRIFLSAAYYRNRSSNQLISYTLPIQTGFSSVIQNFSALVQNTGIEVSLLSKNVETKNLTWNSSINITAPKNKLIKFPGLESSSYASTYVEGESLGVIYAYKFLGVDPSTGIYLFRDVDSSGTFNSKDRMVHGNRDPKIYGGFQNTLTYKQLSLDLFFDFTKQTGRNYLASQLSNWVPGTMNNQPVLVMNRWHKPGQNTTIQKFTTGPGSAAYAASAAYLGSSDGIFSDASFIRLKNVSLSYSLPESWIRKLKMERARIYIQARNVFTLTNYIGADPETQNLYTLPPLKTFVAGIQFNL